MPKDYIVEEVHRIREKIAARYDYDIGAIVAAAMKAQWKSGHKVVSMKPKTSRAAASHRRHAAKRASGGGGRKRR